MRPTSKSGRRPPTKPPTVKVGVLTPSFLAKRGLPRDKANYVTQVIRMRAGIRHLMETATDPDVVEELLCLDSFFEDSVRVMYELAAQRAGGSVPPKGAA